MEIKTHIDNLKNNGFSTLNNVLSQKDIEFLKDMLGHYISIRCLEKKKFFRKNNFFKN